MTWFVIFCQLERVTLRLSGASSKLHFCMFISFDSESSDCDSDSAVYIMHSQLNRITVVGIAV